MSGFIAFPSSRIIVLSQFRSRRFSWSGTQSCERIAPALALRERCVDEFGVLWIATYFPDDRLRTRLVRESLFCRPRSLCCHERIYSLPEQPYHCSFSVPVTAILLVRYTILREDRTSPGAGL